MKLFKLFFPLLAAVCVLLSCEKKGNEVPPPPEENHPFTIELVSKTVTSITVKVTPENPDGSYFIAPIPEETLKNQYSSDGMKAAEAVVKLWKDNYANLGYESFEALFNEQTCKGEKTESFGGLDSEEGIYCIVFGLEPSGEICTEAVVSEKFVTEKAQPSDNTFDIRMTDESIMKVEVTPSNDDPYCYYVVKAEALEPYGSLDEFAEDFVDTNRDAMDKLTCSGYSSASFIHIFENYGDGKYIAFAFGYEGGVITTGVTTIEIDYKKELPDLTEGEPFTKLTGDQNVECTDAYYEYGYDQFNESSDTYFLALQAEGSFGTETRAGLYIQCEKGKEFLEQITGELQINGSMEDRSIVKGFRNETKIYGSIYYIKDSYSIDATIDTGTMTTEDLGDGRYHIVLDAADCNGNKIKAEYSGYITFYSEG